MPEEEPLYIWVWTPMHGVRPWFAAFPTTDLGENFLTLAMDKIAEGSPEGWKPRDIYFFATESEMADVVRGELEHQGTEGSDTA